MACELSIFVLQIPKQSEYKLFGGSNGALFCHAEFELVRKFASILYSLQKLHAESNLRIYWRFYEITKKGRRFASCYVSSVF